MSGSQGVGQSLKLHKKNKPSTQGSGSTKRKPTYSPYHRIARDIFEDISQNSLPEPFCSAIENGNVEKLEKLLMSHSHSQSVINARHKLTGDTPLIMAAKCGNREVVSLLLRYGADISLQNDSLENAFDVATRDIQEAMIEQAKSSATSRDQHLLNASWLGDAVTVRQCLTGEQYIDVNCTNSEGITPLLLVTRDTELFEKVNSTMQSGYNPVEAMQEILDKQADVEVCDSHGRSALHMIANNRSVHATRMVSMLLSHGGAPVDSEDSTLRTPLHYASRRGNAAIIVALVEEGGANVNKPGGERGDTPLMVSAREGQCQTARYLLSRGADINAVNEDGDTALAVAKTTSMVHLLKEAWTETTQEKDHTPSPGPDFSPDDPVASGNHPPYVSMGQEDIDSESELCTPMSTISMVTEEPRNLETSPTGPTFITQQNQLHFRSLSDPALVTMAADLVDKTVREQSVGESLAGDDPIARSTRPLSRSRKGRSLPSEPRGRTRSLADITHHSRQRSSQTRLPALDAHSNKPLPSEDRRGPPTTRPRPQDPRRYSLDLAQAQEDKNRPQMATNGSTQRKPHKMKHGSADNVAMETKVDDSSRLLPGVKPSVTGNGNRKRTLSTGDQKAKGLSSRQPKSPHTERRGRVVSNSDKNATKQVAKQPAIGTVPREASGKRGSPSRSFLPVILSNAKPVAMVAVEMDKEVMYYQKWPEQGPPLSEENPQGKAPDARGMKPSKSSSAVKSRREGGVTKAGGRPPLQQRSSTGSIGMLLGTSLFPGHLDPAYQDTITHHRGNVSHAPGSEDKNLLALPTLPASASLLSSNETSRSSEGPTTPTRPHPPLSAVVEVRETPTPSPKLDHKSPLQTSGSNLSGAHTTSTIISGFSADSLDSGRGRAHSLDAAPKEEENPVIRADSLMVRKGRTSSVPTLPEVAKATSIITMVAPTPIKVGNIVINYPAVKEGDSPLSPIWYLQRHLSCESEGDSPDYITSNLGQRTPIPKLRAPESPSNGRHDSGQGESDSSDSKLCSESSDDSSVDNEALEAGPSDDDVLRWKKGKLLGKGAYGRVWEGLLDSTHMVAVKEVELDVESQERAEAQFDKLQMEVGILRSLSHRNVVGYLGACMNGGTVFIFMEYVSGGSIQNLLKRFGSLSEKMVSHYSKQILKALHYLHFNKIMHRDVKGANILVTPKGVIKLIDFGCAKTFFEQVDSMALHSVRGTPYWMAPEIIIGHDYGPKSDIWSLGATIHEMATTHPPWGKLVPEAAMFQIGIGKSFPALPESTGEDMKDLYRLCLAREPAERPSADELLEHKFFRVHRSQPRPQPRQPRRKV